ncbi:hypothetical protein DIPPA_18457 [Diplonema papillatum]|nr:hypothetical protein DIPPA_18457 [Diplonema papillatum]|eukprot:gene15044-22960_t
MAHHCEDQKQAKALVQQHLHPQQQQQPGMSARLGSAGGGVERTGRSAPGDAAAAARASCGKTAAHDKTGDAAARGCDVPAGGDASHRHHRRRGGQASPKQRAANRNPPRAEADEHESAGALGRVRRPPQHKTDGPPPAQGVLGTCPSEARSCVPPIQGLRGQWPRNRQPRKGEGHAHSGGEDEQSAVIPAAAAAKCGGGGGSRKGGRAKQRRAEPDTAGLQPEAPTSQDDPEPATPAAGARRRKRRRAATMEGKQGYGRQQTGTAGAAANDDDEDRCFPAAAAPRSNDAKPRDEKRRRKRKPNNANSTNTNSHNNNNNNNSISNNANGNSIHNSGSGGWRREPAPVPGTAPVKSQQKRGNRGLASWVAACNACEPPPPPPLFKPRQEDAVGSLSPGGGDAAAAREAASGDETTSDDLVEPTFCAPKALYAGESHLAGGAGLRAGKLDDSGHFAAPRGCCGNGETSDGCTEEVTMEVTSSFSSSDSSDESDNEVLLARPDQLCSEIDLIVSSPYPSKHPPPLLGHPPRAESNISLDSFAIPPRDAPSPLPLHPSPAFPTESAPPASSTEPCVPCRSYPQNYVRSPRATNWAQDAIDDSLK